MANLRNIEGIGETYAQKLQDIGLRTTKALLAKGATPQGRKEIAEKTGLSDAYILKWVNRADLFRIKGIGKEYSDLLEAAGVDTVLELSHRVPENLCQKLAEVNAAKKLVRKLPALSQVKGWVAQAKKMPRGISF